MAKVLQINSCEECKNLDKGSCKLLSRPFDRAVGDFIPECPLYDITIETHDKIFMNKQLPIDDVIEKLQPYLELEGTEFGESIQHKINLLSYGDYISDIFEPQLEDELRYDLYVFENCYTIEKTTKVIPEKVVEEFELVQTHYLAEG